METSKKPSTGLTVIAVLQIIFGVMGLAALPMAFAARGMAADPISKQLYEITWSGMLGIWTRIAVGIGFFMSCALIGGGVGNFKLEPWGRKLTQAYAVTAIITAIIGQAMSITFMYPRILELLEEHRGNPIAMGAAYGGIGGGVCGGLFGLALPITLLVVMNRNSMKSQFTA